MTDEAETVLNAMVRRILAGEDVMAVAAWGLQRVDGASDRREIAAALRWAADYVTS